uniref:Uncharacterized protein n=1 Tax=Romanomermis culicivorax TaxID=13658 RepID=A0A915JL21_ROMCU
MKYRYLKAEREQARKQHENIDYILSCCVYDLELVINEMDKPKARMIAISPEALNLKVLITELMFLWAAAYQISWGQLDLLECRQLRLTIGQCLGLCSIRCKRFFVVFLVLLDYGVIQDLQNCFQLFPHHTIEPELIADLTRRFRETFEDKERQED